MLVYLTYERNRKQWNIRVLMLLLLCTAAAFLLAFKKKARAQSDFGAIITAVPNYNSGELNILTYNIAGLPELISSAITPREASIQTIGHRINKYDIVNIQEDFNYNKFLYKENTHPYRTLNMGGVPFGDGLSTLSNYPIRSFERVTWLDCNGADCFTPKGFTHARVQLAYDVFLDVYNVHATAQDDYRATVARTRNLQQLATYIQKFSAGRPLLLMGDFNAHYAFERDWIRSFSMNLGLSDSWVLLENDGVIPAIAADFSAQDALQITDNCESIDKIYFRSSAKVLLNPSAYKVENNYFQDEVGAPLSDHVAVSLKLAWEIIQ